MQFPEKDGERAGRKWNWKASGESTENRSQIIERIRKKIPIMFPRIPCIGHVHYTSAKEDPEDFQVRGGGGGGGEGGEHEEKEGKKGQD